jgi:hypothetical protein
MICLPSKLTIMIMWTTANYYNIIELHFKYSTKVGINANYEKFDDTSQVVTRNVYSVTRLEKYFIFLTGLFPQCTKKQIKLFI